MFWKPRLKITDSHPKEVAFYYAQYVEVMKHGKDKIDARLKSHLYDILLELGVPDTSMFNAPLEDDIEVEVLDVPEDVPQIEHRPIIHRDKCGPRRWQ
jgi:aspartyl-tRNA synthetase